MTSSSPDVGTGDATRFASASSTTPSASVDVDVAVPDGEAETRNLQQDAPSANDVTGGQTIESTARREGGYQGSSVMRGGDGGVAPPDDIAGEHGAQVTASNIAGSNPSYMASRGGVDVDTQGAASLASTPSSEAAMLEGREFHARDDAAAQANVVTDRTDKAQAVYDAPSEHAEEEGRSRLRAESASRTPTAVSQAEEGVAEAKQARAVASNPEQAGKSALRDVADERKANVQADVEADINVKVTKPDGSSES